MKVLVTGGAGYIGSHTVVQLLEQGSEVLVLDNLSNANPEVFNRIEKITGKRPGFIEGDVRDGLLLDQLFSQHAIDCVIHFAGLKAVGESVEKPLSYYQNNVEGSLSLLDAMAKAGCKKIVFSSSATVYGDKATVPYKENALLSATSPYGRTKLMVEDVLRDISKSDSTWQVAILRYFNPIGAHNSGLIGEDPNGIPNNLAPYVAQVAVGKLPQLNIFGGDYPTKDGTGVRDYIHVVDLANGHLKALSALHIDHGCVAYNLGAGKGYSVLDVVAAFARATGSEIPYSVSARRSGDLAEFYADPLFTEVTLGWRAEKGLDDMVRDHWNWQKRNPEGY